MAYEIKYKDIQTLRTAAVASCLSWQKELLTLQDKFIKASSAMGMQGETAESISGYIHEIHGTIIAHIVQMLTEYIAKISVYEEGYLEIDSSSDMHITQDVLETRMTDFQSRQEQFSDLHDNIQNVLDSVSDICDISRPSSSSITEHFQNVQNELNRLNDEVSTYENMHLRDCESVREYMQTIQSFIHGQSGKGQVIISTYKVGSLCLNTFYQRLGELAAASAVYGSANNEHTQAVLDRMSAEIQSQIDKEIETRKNQAIWEIVNGVVAVGTTVIGVAAIAASGGIVTPFAAGLISVGGSTTITYSIGEIDEGINRYELAEMRDLLTEPKNMVRDSVFGGNQAIYDMWGLTGNCLFLSGNMVYGVTVSNSTGITSVNNLSERAQVVSKGAGTYGIDMDNLNFSKTVQSHAGRPYQESKLTINEIIESMPPSPDPRGTGALSWDVEGTFNGTTGHYELIIDPKTNTVWHFVFKSK